MSFKLSLYANGTQQFIPLSTIMRLDMPSLYVQSIAGLAKFAFENQACQDQDSLAGRLFTKGACQSLAMGVCMLEAPHHCEKLCDEYQMKDSSMHQEQVTGVDIMHRLNQQVWQHLTAGKTPCSMAAGGRQWVLHTLFLWALSQALQQSQILIGPAHVSMNSSFARHTTGQF